MKILVLAGGVPYPPTWGSGMRTFQLLRHIARRHDVTLLCPAAAADRDRVEALATEVPGLSLRTVAQPGRSRRARRVRQARAVVGPLPFLAAEVRSAQLQSGLDSIVHAERFDVIQLEGSQLASLRIPSGPALVVNAHNIEYEMLDRMRRAERTAVRRAFNSLEYLKYRSYEHRVWHRADGCAVVSDRELALVRAATPGTPAFTVPNAVDPDFFAPGSDAIVPDSLVFTGLLSYRPNFDAALHLVDSIFPLIRRRRPGATLTVVGDGDAEHFAALRRDGVTVTGRVPDLRPYVRRAAVCVAPIRMGGGTRLKVLEALSMGKAIVSTPLGSEGIDARDREHLLIAQDRPVVFAEAVVSLLADPVAASRLGRQGRRLVETRYTWERAASQMEELYGAAVRSGRPALSPTTPLTLGLRPARER